MKQMLALATMVVISVLLAACSAADTPAQTPQAGTAATALGAATAPVAASGPIPPSPVANVGNPEPGKATVMGRVRAVQADVPLIKIFVHLAEVTRQDGEAVYVLDAASSPRTETASDGSFVIQNIVAREYVVVVGDPFGSYVVIPDETDRAKVWNAAPDQILDVGLLRVDLPLPANP